MPEHQMIGLILFAAGVVDTAVGHLFVAPRVTDEAKRRIVRVAFAISGVGISGLGLAIYRGFIRI